MLEEGIKGTIERATTPGMSAQKVGSGDLDVFATPVLVALAEETALKSVSPYLEEGQGTVGTKVDIAHIAATPIGMKVRCETELVEVDRRRLVFNVEVYDEVERVAQGTHERFIVDAEKFLAKAESKGGTR